MEVNNYLDTFTSNLLISNSRKFIIKKRRKSFIFNKITLEKIQQISHQGIIKILELYEDPEYNYIRMEYFDGILLEKCILKNYNIHKIIRQIINVVTLFNKNNIISLDINPKKILVNKNSEIKVIDFTRSFLSEKKFNLDEIYFGFNIRNVPQKTLQTGIIDISVNLYSLGILIYYLNYNYYPNNINLYLEKKCIYNGLIKNLILNQDN